MIRHYFVPIAVLFRPLAVLFRPLAVLLALALLPTACTQAAPPPSDVNSLPSYLQALSRSTDPASKAIRLQIADGPAALARERAAAEKEGIPTRLSQLSPPLPPDSRNAALLYAQLDALRKQKPLHFPLYAQSLSGRYAYTPAQLAAVQREYEARQDVFTLLHQAADSPYYVLHYDWSNPFNEPFLEYAGLREDARELKTESFLLAAQGHYSEAIVQQTRGYRVAEHVGSVGTLLSYLTAHAIESMTTSGMQDILHLAGPNAAVDAQITQAITNESAHLSVSHALRGEVALADGNFILLKRGNPAALAYMASGTSSQAAQAEKTLTPPQKKIFLNLLDAAEADYIHRMRRAVRVAETADPSTAFVQAKREAMRDTANSITSQIAVLLLSFVSDNLNALPGRSIASRQVTLAAAFLLGEKAKTGTYPDTLPQEFRDPITNTPLSYHREGTDGFVVYSTGPTGNFETLFRYPAQAVPIPADMLK